MGNSSGHSLFIITLAVVTVCLFAISASAQDEAEALFKAKCSLCHAEDGSSRTAGGVKMHIPDLRSKAVQSLSDEALFESIAHGTSHKEFPHAWAHRGMSEDQIHELVKYLRHLPPANQKHAPR